MKQKVLLVGADTGEEDDFEHSMEELENLAKACFREVAGIVIQRMEKIHKAFYVGKGKVDEIREQIEQLQVQEVIFDNDLTPSQVRNLSEAFQQVSITDRTGLILEIFASRAGTRESKLQVEMARLQYLLPRLAGNYEKLGRQGGAAGSMSNKGSGEKKIELDRRRIEKKLDELKKELEQIATNRDVMRKKRMNSDIPQVALVGYTNAGKSTIMNHFISCYHNPQEKKVLEKDMLFATLDTSIRFLNDSENKPFYLVDTVGFIHKLPHALVKAFRSTLEEVKYADLIVQVVDWSDDAYKKQMQVTEETLKELGAGMIPMITVYNKADRRNEERIPGRSEDKIYISAVRDEGISELAQMIKEKLYSENMVCEFRIPYEKGEISSFLMENGTVSERKYTDEGICLKMSVRRELAEKFSEYLQKRDTES